MTVVLSACATADPSLVPGVRKEGQDIYSASEMVMFAGSPINRAVRQCEKVGGKLDVMTTSSTSGLITGDTYSKIIFRCFPKTE